MTAVVDITAEGGLQAATFRTVAQRAGVSVRLVQYYFGDKDRLLADTLTFVSADVAERVAAALAALGDDPEPRPVLEAICEAFLPADEPRRRAMLVFIAFGTASLTDASLRASGALRRGLQFGEVIAQQLRRVRSDEHHDADALLLVMAIVGVGNGVLAGDLTVERARHLLGRELDRALTPSGPR